MTLPTETIATVGYEVTTTGGLSVAGTAERLAVNEPRPGVAYTGMVEPEPGSASRNVVADLVDVWDPTPDVPTSSGEFALSALRDEEFVGRVGTRPFGEFVGELGRTAARPLDWTISFYETIGVLSPDCSGDYAEQDERGGGRKLNAVVCDRGVATQNAIVQVAHRKGESGTVEFTSRFGLNPPTTSRPTTRPSTARSRSPTPSNCRSRGRWDESGASANRCRSAFPRSRRWPSTPNRRSRRA
jgi:hypothetical protein